MTRNPASARVMEAAGIRPALVDVFDPGALKAAVIAAAPEVVIHQLTDLPSAIQDEAQLAAAYPRNARIRTEGTRNLSSGTGRFIVQSIAFGYAPGGEPHTEADPLDVADSPRSVTVRGAADMERQVLASGIEAIILRYGFFYGPGTWHEEPTRKPALHIDAAAHAALLAVGRGPPGIYNVAEEDGTVSSAKARAAVGFDPAFRLPA